MHSIQKNTRSQRYAIIKIAGQAGSHPVEQGDSDNERVKKRGREMAETKPNLKPDAAGRSTGSRQFCTTNHQFHIQEKQQKEGFRSMPPDLTLGNKKILLPFHGAVWLVQVKEMC